MSVVQKAVRDSREVARLAVDAAKNELVENLVPEIKRLIDKQLRSSTLSEDVDRLRRYEDGYGETEFEESKDMKNNTESISSIFPQVNEVTDMEMNESDDNYDEVAEASDSGDEGLDEAVDDLDESIEINEAELEAMYAESLQLEAEVSKGFKEMERPHELGAGAKGAYQSDGGNLADYKSGDSQWDSVDVPAKQDWTVKEIRQIVNKGLRENKALAEQNGKLREIVSSLKNKLREMNLLNTKILSVNKVIGAHRLTNEQKKMTIEGIDRGRSIAEVKNLAKIIENSFKVSGAISETRRVPHANSQKRRTSGAGNPKVIRESADRAESNGGSRWQELAGLKKQ